MMIGGEAMGTGEPKNVDVCFGTGSDFLHSYWGYLSGGGLIIDGERDLRVGEPVALRVSITSSKSEYRLTGRVVRAMSDRATIAFDPSQPHDMLLTAALAETEHVPARRHRRYTTQLHAEVRNGRGGADGQMIDIGLGGCCVRLDHPDESQILPTGATVTVRTERFQMVGRIVWTHGHERGVEFDNDDPGLDDVRVYVDTL
jgi:hypothetical protein